MFESRVETTGREIPQPMHLCGSWYALPTTDQAAVLDAFGLTDPRTVTMEAGAATWTGDVKPSRRDPVPLHEGDLDALLIDLAVVRDAEPGKTLHYRNVDGGRAREHIYVAADDPVSVEIDGLGIYARAAFVVDRQGVVVYSEYVPEVAQEPNYSAILDAAKAAI